MKKNTEFQTKSSLLQGRLTEIMGFETMCKFVVSDKFPRLHTAAHSGCAFCIRDRRDGTFDFWTWPNITD